MASKKTTETKRGRGRPQSFPGADLVSIMTRVPAETQEQLRELASRRSLNLNQAFADIIGKAFAASERGRNQAATRKNS